MKSPLKVFTYHIYFKNSYDWGVGREGRIFAKNLSEAQNCIYDTWLLDDCVIVIEQIYGL